MNLNKFIDLVKFTGTSQLKEIVLEFDKNNIVCYNSSVDRAVASYGRIDNNTGIEGIIGIPSIPIFQKLLSSYNTFSLDNGKLVFKGDEIIKISLKEPEEVVTYVGKKEFNNWVELIKNSEDKVNLKLTLDDIKNILYYSKLISATEVSLYFNTKELILLATNDNKDSVEKKITECKSEKEFRLDFGYPLLDVLGIDFEDNDLLLTAGKEIPLLLETKNVTYLVAPIDNEEN